MLSGMGADEIFAGYPRYLAYGISRSLDRVPRPVTTGLERLVSGAARPGRPGGCAGRAATCGSSCAAPACRPPSATSPSPPTTRRPSCGGLLTPGFAAGLGDYDPLAGHRELFERVARTGRAEPAALPRRQDVPALPQPHLHGQDGDGRLRRGARAAPRRRARRTGRRESRPNLKLNRLKRKYIFKKSQESVLPHDIVWRKKAGFGAPIRSWLVKDLAPLVRDALSEGTLARRGIVDPATVPG